MTEKFLLEGLRVVELATFVFAPAAGTILGDFGADVIHIEHPQMGDAYRHLPQLRPLPEARDQRDGAAVEVVERAPAVAQLRSPVAAGAPGGALQHQSGAVPHREIGVALEVAFQRLDARLALQQHERRKGGKLQAVVEDQRGLDAAIGQE